MEISDIQAVWRHIKAIRPTFAPDKIPRLTKEIAEAWRINLEGYTLEQVLRATDFQLGKHQFWPDLSEIMAELPPPPPSRTRLIPGGKANSSAPRREDPVLVRYRELLEKYEKKRVEAGVPATFEEAKAAGMTVDEADKFWKKLGLDATQDPEFQQLIDDFLGGTIERRGETI